ncbi:MAG: ATP synthase gamma chain [Candidatus Levybacteria bacterium GW2011_GWC2_37_7]|nr:MAG: ATP synthase gamma chain [Candidatus Levybacteria bacterium GW2011_GWC2_37_7]
MVTKKELTKEAEFLTTLRTILETYEEIAATRMARIRSSVLASRDFLLEINAIFQQVKTSYKTQTELLMQTRKIKDSSKLTFIKRNGKTLYVFISANTGLYGEIIRRTYDVFVENLRKEPGDVAILGKLGMEIFNEEKIKAPLTYFEFPDNKMDNEAVQKIVEHIIRYEKVLVFYEQFNNVISQSPIVTNISGDPLPWEKGGPQAKYFFEPSLEKIMEFFEKEIFASIFQQTIFESELAKFAARMVSLDFASENTKIRLKQVIMTRQRIKHQEDNKRQLEKFASMRLWK